MRKYLESSSVLTLVMAAGLLLHSPAHANPEGGVVAAGSATITEAGKKLDIHQSTDKVVIDWRAFNIAPDEHTQFHQPNSGSIALNRISSGDASQIMGKLSANGNVIIVNPSGVVFGKDSQVDVNGLVATSSDIGNADFMAGNLNFSTAGHADAAIINKGTITAKDAGLVGLVAPHVSNSGTITAKLGTVQLASGSKFSVDLYGDGLVNVALDDAVTKQVVENSGSIQANGGKIEMTAAAGAHVVNSLINITGELEASTVAQKNGKIIIGGDASTISHTGTMTADSVELKAKNIIQQGKITATDTASLSFKKSYIDNQSAVTKGKTIAVTGDTGSHAFISGTYDASSTTGNGGTVAITAKDGDLKLYGARVKADGKTGGGKVLVGGDYQGGGTLAHTKTTGINYATTLSASATESGDGGVVVVWSDDTTKFGGKAYATGGALMGNGGTIELSSKNTLQVSGNAVTDASAAHGAAGSLLLDPANIIVATGGITGGIDAFELIDPDQDAGTFGGYTMTLQNSNVLVYDSQDDTVATNSGAIYLFDSSTGGLISSLYGGSAGDQIGYDALNTYYQSYTLTNGNVLIGSTEWSNGGAAGAGALTWFNQTTGLSGIINSSNSLVGSTTGDRVGEFSYPNPEYGTVIELANGNYVIVSIFWDNGGLVDAGAVTWGNGATGTSGVISSTNSLVGSSANDRIGGCDGNNNDCFFISERGPVYGLSNGNYVIDSPLWDNGGLTDAGAVTWANGTTGITGTINAGNSLIGASAYDMVGAGGVEVLNNGNYVIGSYLWDNGGAADAGASTWANGTTGISGTISAANSLVGSQFEDHVGRGWFTMNELTNGNYVLIHYDWDRGGIVDAGAVTWVNGTTGITGTIDDTNSLVGDYQFESIGRSGVTALANGNYVVASDFWANASNQYVGAVTWGNGTTGIVGEVTTANSLYGASNGDRIGVAKPIALSNGNYVITSFYWTNGGTGNQVGATTWGNGATGTFGAVTAANSLVGSHDFDSVGGYNDIIELPNGNYLIGSASWTNGGGWANGAITWASGTGPTTGVVSAANSLVGSHDGDWYGDNVVVLSNSNYVVYSAGWQNGTVNDAGIVTWADGNGGTVGVADASNSLVGSSDTDMVGYTVLGLTNGNYVVVSSYWDNGGLTDAGAVTWANGTTGITGTISAANSVVGGSAYDTLGDGAYENYATLANGNFVFASSSWDNGAIADVGAVTWINGTTGMTGTLDDTNSIIGTTAGDSIGSRVNYLSNNDYYIYSAYWDNGTDVNAGAVTVLDGSGPTSGYVSTANSLVGSGSNSGLTNFAYFGETQDRAIFSFLNEQRVFSIGAGGGGGIGGFDSYSDLATSTITLDPTFITNVLNGGTAVTLQASNDITINDDIVANNAGGDGGDLTLQAGRSILINADITTDNGDLNIYANERLATGVVNAQRAAGNAVITMAAGTHLDAGTGAVDIRLDDGLGKTNTGAGSITLRDIIADTISAVNKNTTGDIVLQSGALSAGGAGNSILLSSLRDFINNAGGAALDVQPGANWLVYSTRDTSDIQGGLVSDYSLFACLYAGPCPTLGTGNGFLYSYDPDAVVPSTPVTPPVPDTVLYVSQAPLPARTTGEMSMTGTTTLATIDAEKWFEQTSPFLGGWIYIDPFLVREFGLEKDKI